MARPARGFTLVELLVALFAMALLAIMSWRALDGMVRVQQTTEQRADQVLALQVGLAQWAADLDALEQLPLLNALDWNGRVLRLTRRGTGSLTDGVHVVGWTRGIANGTSQWLRWQSPPLTTRGQVEDAWARAEAWSRNQAEVGAGSAVAVVPLADWTLYYFRSDAWTNPLSSDATAAPVQPPPVPPPAAQPQAGQPPQAPQAPQVPQVPRTSVLPDGVRLVLQLPAGQAIAGEVIRDWARPTVGGGKS